MVFHFQDFGLDWFPIQNKIISEHCFVVFLHLFLENLFWLRSDHFGKFLLGFFVSLSAHLVFKITNFSIQNHDFRFIVAVTLNFLGRFLPELRCNPWKSCFFFLLLELSVWIQQAHHSFRIQLVNFELLADFFFCAYPVINELLSERFLLKSEL